MTDRNCIRVLFLPMIVMAFLMIGCGGGGGGGGGDDDSSNDSSSEPTLLVSSTEAVPGSFITIEDDSINEGDDLDVTFENTSGFEVTIKTILTKDGTAEVPVPPIANLSTGNFISSKVTVSIPSGSQATLNVLTLPKLTGVAPGDVVKMYLSYAKSSLETSLDNMDKFSLEFVDYDTSELEQQIQTQIDSIEASINEIETSSQMSIYSYYDGKIILDQDDLSKLDQLLFAVLKGAMEEDFKENVIASVNILAAGSSEPTLEQLSSWLTKMKNDINKSTTALVGAVGMVVTVGGYIIGAAAGGTTILFTSLAAGASILVVGTASEGIAAFEAFIDPNKEYEFGNEYQKAFEEAIINIGVAAGGGKSELVNLISFLNTTYDVKTALSYLICNSDPVPFGFEDYCKEWEASHQPRELAIQLFRFSDKVMAPGVEGGLRFFLQGDKDAGKVEVTIDWGDGSAPEKKSLDPMDTYDPAEYYPEFPEIFKYPYLKHSYTLGEKEAAKSFKISVHALDSNGNEAWASTIVDVIKNIKLSVAISSIPSRIKTNTTRAWGVTVKGGKPPYTYKMYWGDEITEGIFDTADDWTLNHKYTSKGIYTANIEVTDANDLSVSDTFEADVRDPVSIVSITGPTSLDWVERGAWAVSLDGGWGSYGGFVEWGDLSDLTPIDSQTRQFNISHAYKQEDPKKKEDTFSVLVTITDDEGDMDTKGFTVKVPKTSPSFPITLTIWDVNEPNRTSTLHMTLTINDDDTITLSGKNNGGRDIVETTELNFNSFVFTWLRDGGVTEILEGTIDIDESTGVYSGSGTYSLSTTSPAAGTWTSD